MNTPMQQRKRVLLAASCAAAGAFGVWLTWSWQRLKRTPALTQDSCRAGISGAYTPLSTHGFAQTGAPAMFHRIHPGPPGSGARTTVVLVHGLVVSSRYMEPLMHALGRDFRVLAPDLPGYGESCIDRAIRPKALSIPTLSDALHEWLRACGIERASFVGNSFGCQILADFACRYPAMVDRLVLQGPTTDAQARTLWAQARRDFVNGRREQARSPAGVARIDYAKAGLWRAWSTMRILIRDRIEDRLPHIVAPTLVIAGTRDPVVPLQWAQAVTALLPHGSLVIVDGGTHTMNYAYPYALAQAITPFLEGEIHSVDEEMMPP